ncbi:hypothetical protein GCM10007984_37390 [Shewanella putrefaciens]|nr:hypothetical protein SPWS13_3056 [Shewanella putrefaciens]GGN31529.1 hypothetical protein GCM10007984_37390 [Shewanella putrefaciens]
MPIKLKAKAEASKVLEKRDLFAEKLKASGFEVADVETDFDTESDKAGDIEDAVIAIAYCCFYKLSKLHGH